MSQEAGQPNETVIKPVTEITDDRSGREIITFPTGILAFEENKQFIAIPVEGNPIFKCLQSVDEPNLSFLLIDPFVIKPDFYVDIEESVREELDIKKQEDVLVYTIVAIPEEGHKKATTNLLAPIVINVENKKAKQIVLDGTLRDIKYHLFLSEQDLEEQDLEEEDFAEEDFFVEEEQAETGSPEENLKDGSE